MSRVAGPAVLRLWRLGMPRDVGVGVGIQRVWQSLPEAVETQRYRDVELYRRRIFDKGQTRDFLPHRLPERASSTSRWIVLTVHPSLEPFHPADGTEAGLTPRPEYRQWSRHRRSVVAVKARQWCRSFLPTGQFWRHLAPPFPQHVCGCCQRVGTVSRVDGTFHNSRYLA